LLSQYSVEIDMQHRRLRLISPGEEFRPPVAKDPFGSRGLFGPEGNDE
jgi:hypothetical protein